MSDDDDAVAVGHVKVGDNIELSGGYDPEPAWLDGRSSVCGRVASFIPGQNEQSAVVIRLDEAISVGGVNGDTLILELRYAGLGWTAAGTVHVELCDFEPESRQWQARRHGKWVESHASYIILLDQP